MEKTVMRSCVTIKEGSEYSLEYCIFSFLPETDAHTYGLTVKQRYRGIITSEAAIVSDTEESVLRKNYFFKSAISSPVSMHDLLESMRSQPG